MYARQLQPEGKNDNFCVKINKQTSIISSKEILSVCDVITAKVLTDPIVIKKIEILKSFGINIGYFLPSNFVVLRKGNRKWAF